MSEHADAQLGECHNCFAPCGQCPDIVRGELRRLRTDLEAARAAMPSTFYAGQPLAERIRKMSDLWNRAIVANEAAEADLEAAREALMDLLASDHSTARAKARGALARLSAGKETGDE